MLSNDTASHVPPTAGNQNYNGTPFVDFPALGGSYLDGVFGSVDPTGSTVRRLTNVGANTGLEVSYAFHYINADATACFHYYQPGTFDIISTADGSTLHASQPAGLTIGEVRWDMLDADKYYYLSGTDLVRRNLAAQTNTTMKTFPATLQVQGQSQNVQSADGRYFVVKYSNFHHVWDSQTDTIYTGNIPPATSTGYMGITPDGKFCYSGGNTGPAALTWFNSYAIDHVGHSVNTTAVQFYGLNDGDHGVGISASDGKNYVVTWDDQGSTLFIRRAEMGVDRSAMSQAAQRADTTVLITYGTTFDTSAHFSSVSVGTNSDWAFITFEAAGDNFNAAPSPWHAYKQEVAAVNVITLEVRRFAHHRSRGDFNANYETQPKVSCSPKGDFIIFQSNMNDSTPADYADMWGIASPLGTAAAPDTSVPTNLVPRSSMRTWHHAR